MVVFKQPLESRLATVLHFSHLSLMATQPQQESWDISLQEGTAPFTQPCKCSERHARRMDGISSSCLSVPQLSACPFPLPGREVLSCPPNHFSQPHQHSHSPPTRALATHLCISIPCLSLLPLSFASNGVSPFLQKMKDTVIVTCSEEIYFTKKVVKLGAHEEISESLRTLSLCLEGC